MCHLSAGAAIPPVLLASFLLLPVYPPSSSLCPTTSFHLQPSGWTARHSEQEPERWLSRLGSSAPSLDLSAAGVRNSSQNLSPTKERPEVYREMVAGPHLLLVPPLLPANYVPIASFIRLLTCLVSLQISVRPGITDAQAYP